MNTALGRTWTGHELATKLQLDYYPLLSQLGRWASTGHLIRTSPATYTLPQPP